jgi:hypothetical protein
VLLIGAVSATASAENPAFHPPPPRVQQQAPVAKKPSLMNRVIKSFKGGRSSGGSVQPRYRDWPAMAPEGAGEPQVVWKRAGAKNGADPEHGFVAEPLPDPVAHVSGGFGAQLSRLVKPEPGTSPHFYEATFSNGLVINYTDNGHGVIVHETAFKDPTTGERTIIPQQVVGAMTGTHGALVKVKTVSAGVTRFSFSDNSAATFDARTKAVSWR